jgi:thermostable 8-oxoguanine DNA glycosylase
MRKYKDKFLWRNIFYSNFTIIFIITLIFFSVQGVFKVYRKYTLTKKDYIFVAEEEEEVRHKLSENEYKFNNINTEDGRDKYIRETYQVKKPGEELIIVYNSPSSTYDIPKSESAWDLFKKFIRDLVGF